MSLDLFIAREIPESGRPRLFYRPFFLFLALPLAIQAFSSPEIGASEAPAAMEILHQHCLRCHSEEKRKGGLLLESRESILAGGDSGPVTAAGQSGGSLLIETLFPESESHMPPKGQLTPTEIATLEHWIDEGLPWDDQAWARLRESPLDGPVALSALPHGYRPIFSMALSPDGSRLVVGRGNRLEWRTLTSDDETSEKDAKPALFQESPGSKEAPGPETIQSLAWSPDGRLVAVGTFRRITVWETVGQTQVGELATPLSGRISALAFSPDSRFLLAADSSDSAIGRLHWIDPTATRILRSLDAHSDAIFDLDISPDGELVASASADRSTRLWSLAEGKLIRTLEGHTGYVLAAAFSPANDRLATAGDDAEVKVWRLDTGKKVAGFGGTRTGPITGLFWTTDPANIEKKANEKDQEKAAAINVDRILTINEAGQPRVYTELNEHEGAQRSTGAREKALSASETELAALAYDPATHRFFAGSTEGELLAWDSGGTLLFREVEPSGQSTDSQ